MMGLMDKGLVTKTITILRLLVPRVLLLLVVPADVGFDALSSDGVHGHGHGFRRGQPIGVVVAGGKVTDVVDVAEHEGHGAEPPQTTASRTWREGGGGRGRERERGE